MNAIEKVRKIRESYLTHDSFYKVKNVFVLSESEAAALLTDEPSKTAEELLESIYLQLRKAISEAAIEDNPPFVSCLMREKMAKRATDAMMIALTAHAKAKVEDAADRFRDKYCPLWIHNQHRKPSSCKYCPGGFLSGKDNCGYVESILGREAGE